MAENLFFVFFYGFSAVSGYFLAKSKGRDPIRWVIICFIFPVLAVVVLVFMKSLRREQDLYPILKNIRGIGDQAASMILAKYPNSAALRKAKAKDLAELPGISEEIAKAIKITFK